MDLSQSNLECLAGLFFTLIESENKMEMVKQVLAEQRLFEPQAAFKRLDQQRVGYLDLSGILEFLEENKVVADQTDILYLLYKMDINNDTSVDLLEYYFQNYILPKNDQRLIELVQQRQVYEIKQASLLPYEVEWALSRALEQDIHNNRKIRKQEQILQQCNNFTSLAAFEFIDKDCKGRLSTDDILQFLKSRQYYVTREEVMTFFQSIKNVDQTSLTYSDFIMLIETPLPLEQSPHITHVLPQKQEELEQTQLFIESEQDQEKVQEREKQLERKQQTLQEIRKDRLRTQEDYQRLISSDVYQKQDLNMSKSILQESCFSGISKKQKSRQNTLPYTSKSRVYQTPKRYNYTTNQNICKISPLKGNEEHHLAVTFKQQINLCTQIEELRKQLSLRQDFHPATAFRMLDKYERGQLTKLDFELALNEIGLNPTKDEILLFFQHYAQQSSFFTYKHFVTCVLPQNQEYQEKMLSRVVGQKFMTQTLAMYKNMFQKHFKNEIEGEELRQKLIKRQKFNLQQAFQAIDRSGTGYITIEGLSQLFEKQNIPVTNSDLEVLYRNFIKNSNGKVGYSEFVNQMSAQRSMFQ